MADEPAQNLHWLPARRPGETVNVGWDAGLRTFYCIVAETDALTRYGTFPRQYVRPEQLFAAIRGQWAWNEADEQMVNTLLRIDRERGPQELSPPLWSDWGRGR